MGYGLATVVVPVIEVVENRSVLQLRRENARLY